MYQVACVHKIMHIAAIEMFAYDRGTYIEELLNN